MVCIRGCPVRRRGFTLIEVLVVLGVLAALAGLALATLSGSRDDRVMTEAVNLATHGVARARASAMLEGRALALYARQRSASQWGLEVAPVVTGEEGDEQAPPARPRTVAAFPDGVSLRSAGRLTNEEEDARGAADSDGPLALLLPDGRCLPRTELELTYKDQAVRLRLRRLSPGIERVGAGP